MNKKLLLLMFVFASTINLFAEDVIQIKPANISAGLTDDDEICLEVKMVNESFSVANLYFDLLLPEGVEYSYYEEGEAIPYTKKGSKYNYDFDVQTNVLESGYTRFLFVPKNELRPIENSGEVLLYLYITTSSTLKDGIYPILIDNIELDKTVTVSIKDIGMTASYLTVGSYSLETAAHVDLSGMTGYIPSFVVNQLNTDIASNTSLKSLNLSGATSLGADIVAPTGSEMLWYTSDKASLNRSFAADKWSTICLPFSMSSTQVNALKNNCDIMQMASYDAEKSTINVEDATEMSVGKPYLVKAKSEKALFEDVSISDPVAVTEDTNPVTDNALSMVGCYQEQTVTSAGNTTYYGFNDGRFLYVASGKSAKVNPFRAYLELSGPAGTRAISIGGEDDGTTGIDVIQQDDAKDSPYYNLQGMRMDNAPQSKGIYLRNGKKFMVK